jgi:rhodanese-related sulfurtransferase
MKTITPNELRSLIEANPELPLLDVREPREHQEANIPNSRLIPVGELPMRLSELQDWKKDTIYVYCRSGGRSAWACELMSSQGFSTVNLTGGMIDWLNTQGS